MSNWETTGLMGALTGTETVPGNQAGVSKYTTVNMIKTFIASAFEAVGAVAAGIAGHLTAYDHTKIDHVNRVALDLVAGNNTGDQDLSLFAPKNDPTFTGNGIKLPNANSADSNSLDWYKEGAWTPSDVSGANLTLTSSNCNYTRIGNMVFLSGTITYPATADATAAAVGGLPYDPAYAQPGTTDTPSLTYGGVKAQTGQKLQFYNLPGTAARLNSSLTGITVTVNVAFKA